MNSLESLSTYFLEKCKDNTKLANFANRLSKDLFGSHQDSQEYLLAYKNAEKSDREYEKLRIGSLPINSSVAIAHAYLTIQGLLRTTGLSLSPSLFADSSMDTLIARMQEMIKSLPSVGDRVLARVSNNPSLINDLAGAVDAINSPYMGGEIIFGGGGECEFCVINKTDDDGRIINSRCGEESECTGGCLFFVIFAAISVLGWVTGWW